MVGLATIFGPNDAALDETIYDKAKEMKIIETLLLPRLEALTYYKFIPSWFFLQGLPLMRIFFYSFSEDLDNTNDRNLAIAASLATVLQKNMSLKSPHAVCQIEKCPTFVAREKSIKTKFLSKNKKVWNRNTILQLLNVYPQAPPCL